MQRVNPLYDNDTSYTHLETRKNLLKTSVQIRSFREPSGSCHPSGELVSEGTSASYKYSFTTSYRLAINLCATGRVETYPARIFAGFEADGGPTISASHLPGVNVSAGRPVGRNGAREERCERLVGKGRKRVGGAGERPRVRVSLLIYNAVSTR